MAKDFYAATEYGTKSIQMLMAETWPDAVVSATSSKADAKVTNGTSPVGPKV